MKILLLFLFLLPFTAIQAQTFSAISKKMFTRKVEEMGNTMFNVLHFKSRKKLYRSGKANFLRCKIDTLFIVEGYDIVSSGVIGCIWNKNHVTNYKYFFNQLTIEKERLFSDDLLELVRKFDVLEIKARGFEARAFGGLSILATRIIIQGKRIIIEDVAFSIF